jgi:molecular chaperone HtpG
LSDDAEEFLDRERLSDIVKEYSDHISFPIVMPDEEGEDERINRASALWTRRPSDITADEYEEFYKHVAHDFEEPLTYTHRHVEGRLKFSMLFYVPKQRPFDLKREPESTTEGVKLYVRRVFILDDAEMFLPRYLRFIRGVIDSDDLDLNVSREFLQENRVVAAMRSTAVNKVLDMLSELSEDDEQYQTFWDEFGDIFKEGVVEDDKHSDEIAELLRFASTQEDEERQTVSLDDYVERMPDAQDEIYYITADTFAAAQNSPHLEAFRDNDLEVLLMYEPIDEWVVNSLHEYDGYELQSIARGDVDLDVDEQEDGDREEPDSDEFADLIERFESHLSEHVQDVRLSSRLTESPACLVASEGGITGNMDRILKAAGQASPGFQPILELNPTHPIIQRLNENPGDEHMDDWVQVIFDQALIGEGGKLENPGDYTRRLNRLMTELMQ